MSTTLRKSEILNIARREGKVTVDRLVELLGVTPQTIRRDLTELSDEGALDRVHGGAVLPSSTANIGYDARRQLNQSAKVDIARACARQIPNDCCIFLNIGTTTEAVAQELLHHKGSAGRDEQHQHRGDSVGESGRAGDRVRWQPAPVGWRAGGRAGDRPDPSVPL